MTITRKAEGAKLTLAIEGRIDTSTAPQFEAEAKNLDGVKELVFDFAGVEYISSAGLRVILSAQKAMNSKGSLKLINVNDDVMDVFDITGFIDILTIE